MKNIRAGFIRPRPADPLPFRPTFRRIYILPTGYGLLFALVLFGMLAGSVNYNNNLGFLLTFLLAAMAHVSIHHTHANLVGFEINAISASPVFAGEAAVFRISLASRKNRRPSVCLACQNGEAVCMDFSAGREQVAEVRIPAVRRGRLRPGSLKVETRWPFGFFRAWFLVNGNAACLVYPEPASGELVTDVMADEDESGAGGIMTGGVEDFDGLHRYIPGDPLSRISWKSASRGQGLQTKAFSAPAGAAVLLNWDRLGDTDVERRLSRLCGMVLRAESEGLRYGLRLPGVRYRPDRGARHRQRCLTALALFGEGGGGADQ